MKLSGTRIHLSGSADRATSHADLTCAHDYVRELVNACLGAGAGFILGASNDPQGDAGLGITFDWTALEAIAGAPADGAWPEDRSARIVVVASQAALAGIPDNRRTLWDELTRRADFKLEISPPGWRMAGIIREKQARDGDVLVALGGGAGVEHLADLYRRDGKQVIPLRSNLTGASGDGTGGATRMHEKALAVPADFFELSPGQGDAATRLTYLSLGADTPVQVAAGTVALVSALRPPTVFLVRLVAEDVDGFDAVEQFFRDVAEPVVADQGLTPHQVGHHRPRAPFINLEIFGEIARSGAVIADLTGLRPNCFLELGFSLGLARRTIITARDGTNLPFDVTQLPVFFWDDTNDIGSTRDKFLEWWSKHIDQPPIIRR